MLLAEKLAEMRADPRIRTVIGDMNGSVAQLPDGRTGEVCGRYYEGTPETGSVHKLLVAIPDASNPQEFVGSPIQMTRLLKQCHGKDGGLMPIHSIRGGVGDLAV